MWQSSLDLNPKQGENGARGTLRSEKRAGVRLLSSDKDGLGAGRMRARRPREQERKGTGRGSGEEEDKLLVELIVAEVCLCRSLGNHIFLVGVGLEGLFFTHYFSQDLHLCKTSGGEAFGRLLL